MTILLQKLFIALTMLSTALAATPSSTVIVASSQIDVWSGYAELKVIASCESWGVPDKEPRQFDEKGNVLLGYPNPADKGLMQINEPTWGAKAKELGFDIYTAEGNLAMGKWIFDKYGETPWKYSKPCWKSYALKQGL